MDKETLTADPNDAHFVYAVWDRLDGPVTDPIGPDTRGPTWFTRSTDGGLTWSEPATPGAHGLGGIPLVQPNGNVVVPFLGNNIASFSSSNGGASWSMAVQLAPVNDHPVAGGLRSDALPSAAMDSAGTVYVVWQDCSFRANCAHPR